jgi:GntR family phosphonate transport system transcriptional regulator
MPRPALWIAIADTLRDEIGRGHYAPGARLPTEAQLATRFSVNRHTARRALAALSDEGLIHTRQGAGAFVSTPVTDYPLGRRVRFHRNVLAAGRAPGRRILSLQTRSADETEAEALALAPGAPVIACEGVSLADDVPIALFLSVFPGRLAGLAAALERTGSVTAALAECGVTDHVRTRTRLTAVAADAAQAARLRLPPGAPLLRSIAVNSDAAGRPVEYGRTFFAGDRVTLTLAADAAETGIPVDNAAQP